MKPKALFMPSPCVATVGMRDQSCAWLCLVLIQMSQAKGAFNTRKASYQGD